MKGLHLSLFLDFTFPWWREVGSSRTCVILSVLETCAVFLQKASSTDEAANDKRDRPHRQRGDESML